MSDFVLKSVVSSDLHISPIRIPVAITTRQRLILSVRVIRGSVFPSDSIPASSTEIRINCSFLRISRQKYGNFSGRFAPDPGYQS